MKFGLFYELQLPRPWEPGAELRLMQQSLDQVAQADGAGFDYVWAVEHHFLEEYAHSSAPEVFLAACSQRTRTIRLGHGIVLLPPPYNHPARVAERIASLDLISNGRVEFGSGESSSEIELGGFLIAREHKRELWQESLGVICRMFVEEPFAGYRGKRLRIPVRNVVPKPAQKPHPPLWVACSQRETIRLAARLGIGALSFAFITPEEARQWVSEYHDTFARECTPIGYAVNPQIAIVLPMMCAASEERAHAAGDQGFGFFTYALGHYYVFGRHTPGVTNIFDEYRANAGATPAQNPVAGCVGTPDQIRATLRMYEEAGIDQVAFVIQAGNNRHEDICASLDLFAREVMPEFKARDSVQAAQRSARMAPLMEEILRRRPAEPARPRPVVVKAGRGGVF
jgi:alkanesulfonate monooxygenase SsuD/methylene tetrahydromethanopterin reductase-like flavin-dependent oxidoreductase (luciferase family)